MSRQSHWERVYAKSAPDEVSWFQPYPSVSLELIEACDLASDARILDVGGGASRLVDTLCDRGFAQLGVLDVAEQALSESKQRLGSRADAVEWLVADVTAFTTPHQWDLWHDRAVLHFLTDSQDRTAYRHTLLESVAPGGHVIIATFGPDGPTRCSDLDVRRYSAESLQETLGSDLELIESRKEAHQTPRGVVQQFLYCRFRRLMDAS